MKLRMRPNALRIRLTQSDVDSLVTEGQVSETISFGVEPYQKLVYTVVGRDVHRLEVEYFPGSIEVVLPVGDVNAWASSEQVGFDEVFDLGDDDALSVTVEKDFKCLSDRPGEDDSGAYPNPEAPH